MSNLTTTEFVNRPGPILDRVNRGEQITLTRYGRPVALLSPVGGPETNGQKIERAISCPTPYELRIAAGFQRVQTLANKAGVKSSTIRRYERGEIRQAHEGTYLNFERIAESLGVSCEVYSGSVMRQQDARRNGLKN